MSRVLIVDDEESIRYTLMEFLVDEGHSVKTVEGLREAKKYLEGEDADIVVTDLRLGDGTGIDLLKFVKDNLPFTQVIIITGYPEVETAAQAVRLGAFDYIVKPVKQETILHVVRLADRQRATEEEKERLRANMTAIFQSVEDGIISIDMDMRVTEVNGGIERICGFKREEILHERHDLLDRDCSGRCSELLRKTLREKMVCIENSLRCYHRDRPHQVVSIKTSPLFWGGTFRGAVMVVRDVTFFDPSAERTSGMGVYRLAGESEPMKEVFRMIETLSSVDSTVLITGETGTGKELVAEAIHQLGTRSGGPLVKVNCSAFSAGLLESELFGHVKGAFTGAISNRKGRFELAEGGTILLDEIGDLSEEMQVKLLRVLQEHRVERLGDARPIDVDVRVIAATHHDLRKMVKEGAFRADLYYRLNVVNIHIPPLSW
jgi:PAS domain S-box-containing protein